MNAISVAPQAVTPAISTPSVAPITVTLYPGDNIASLRTMADNSVDSIVTDPPYGLSQHSPEDITNALTAWASGKEYLVKKKGFMGKTWDSFVPGPELWREVYRVLKPGGHVLCFAGSRTDDLMGISLRLGGFEIRDKIMWIYGTGFPKSRNIAKDLDKTAGEKREVVGTIKAPGHADAIVEQGAQTRTTTTFDLLSKDPLSGVAKQWDGWGTALKPAFEPIIVARKPLIGNVAANVLLHGTGGINVDGCRVPTDENDNIHAKNPHTVNMGSNAIYGAFAKDGSCPTYDPNNGRFPANIIHDGSDEVEEAFAVYGDRPGTRVEKPSDCKTSGNTSFDSMRGNRPARGYDDNGSAARFFYCAKASKADRADSKHPTVKPIALMRYLTRLVTPPNGVILDPFAGSGTTGVAAIEEGFNVILMERETEYCTDITNRFVAIRAASPAVVFATISPTPPTAAVTKDTD